MSEVRFDNCLIEIDNVVYYALPTKLVDYVKKLYENNKSYQRQIERLGDKLAENTNYWVRTTDERNELQNQLQQKENIIKEVREKIHDIWFKIDFTNMTSMSYVTIKLDTTSQGNELLEILDKAGDSNERNKDNK